MAGVVGQIGWRLWRRHTRGSIFPEVSREQIRFRESFASGRSHRDRSTRWGGAANCLKVTVTDDELWIVPLFPFSAFAEQFDLEHRILKRRITEITEHCSFWGRSFLVDFVDEEGKSHRVDISPKRPEQFIEALGISGQSNVGPPAV
jgi:hypothetical protein